jgi:hypothetical protein
MTAIIAAIVRLFGVSPAIANIIAIMIAIVIALCGVWAGYELIKGKGAEEVRTQIERDNQDAMRKGIEASRNFDDCDAAGGLWDFRRQRCSGAP